VAIVDDDQSVREALTSLVRALGYVAVTFECAEDLLKSRRRASVSCLITDLQMPGMTGLDLHHRLAASCKPIPTILITAFPDERARERAASRRDLLLNQTVQRGRLARVYSFDSRAP
jgi:FixJ family two-component response regulator